MKLVVGQALFSPVDSTSVIVVRAPREEVTLSCGGADMVAEKERAGASTPEHAEGANWGGTLLGKRYEDDQSGLELLCAKAGRGSLAVNGRVLAIKAAKPLPASD